MTEADIDALEAGPLTDALVAGLMGTPFRKPTHGNCCTCQTCGWPHDECKCGYSDDIEMAWKILRYLKAQGHAFAVNGLPEGTRAWLSAYPAVGDTDPRSVIPHPGFTAEAGVDEEPLAICRAALKLKADPDAQTRKA